MKQLGYFLIHMYKNNVVAFGSLVYAVTIRESKVGCVHLAVETSIEVITVTFHLYFMTDQTLHFKE